MKFFFPRFESRQKHTGSAYASPQPVPPHCQAARCEVGTGLSLELATQHQSWVRDFRQQRPKSSSEEKPLQGELWQQHHCVEQDRRSKQQHTARLLAAGPDGVPVKGLKSCADQLSRVVNSIFNFRLSQALALSCLNNHPSSCYSQPQGLWPNRSHITSQVSLQTALRGQFSTGTPDSPSSIGPHQNAKQIY